MEGIMWYVEHALEVNSRHGRMVPLEEIKRFFGFRSVYAFNETDAETIRSSGCSKGFSRFPVFSDKLVFDLDNGDDGLQNIQAWCNGEGFGYDIYESGSKGLHVEIQTVAKHSILLPETHKKLASKIYPKTDVSIYRHGSLYRLPGTIHKKTGKPKQLVEHVDGESLLDFDFIEKQSSSVFKEFEIDPVEDAQFMISIVNSHMGFSPGKGSRYTTLWKCAKNLVDAGFSEEFVTEFVMRINESWGADAHGEEEVLRAIKGAWL